MRIKILISIVVSLIYLSIMVYKVNAQTISVLKQQLPYEINDIQVSNDRLTIQGWAFISLNQHFLNDATHEIFLVFESKSHQITKKATLKAIDMTSLMHYKGAPTCANDDYHQISGTCNYKYQNVGFEVSLSLNEFQKQESYQTSILVHAKQTNTTYKIQVYYPMFRDLEYKYGDYLFKLSSSLADTKLVVNYTTVLVRSTPKVDSPIHQVGDWCNNTYKNQLFYKLNSQYSIVHAKIKTENMSYYKLGGQLDECFNKRRRVKEGNDIYPMYISSAFLEYAGDSLTIKNELVNTAPILTITHPTIHLDQFFNYKDYVSAYDQEEKDLTQHVKILSSNFKQAIGTYQMELYVEDKHKAFDRKIMMITVKGPLNNPPQITAYDQTIKQYSEFNPLAGVSAYDIEDGDLTSKIRTTNHIDTSQLGSFKQCYMVEDSHKAQANQCINVNIIERTKITSIRFVKDKYYQNVHESWRPNINTLKYYLKQNSALISLKMN